MHKIALALLPVVLVLPAAANAQDAVVDVQTAIRCSALFALIDADQRRGVTKSIRDYPLLRERGREFFVQTSARFMDEYRWSREDIEVRLKSQIAAIYAETAGEPDPGVRVREMMAPCLVLLDATVPAKPDPAL